MRRRLCVLALAAALALVACGDDDGGSADATTTTAAPTTSPTETAPADPAAEVDAFCAATDELRAILDEVAQNPDQQPTADQQARLQEVGGDATQRMMTLQASTAHMVPGDVARFQECAAVLSGGGAPQMPPGP